MDVSEEKPFPLGQTDVVILRHVEPLRYLPAGHRSSQQKPSCTVAPMEHGDVLSRSLDVALQYPVAALHENMFMFVKTLPTL
jgi:hypothetical protein